MSTNPNQSAPSPDPRINQLEEQLAATRQEVAATRSALEAQSEQIAEVLKSLNQRIASSAPGTPDAIPAGESVAEGIASFVTRRSMLKKAALATLGAATVMETMPSAQAANGSSVLLGTGNMATATTSVTTTTGSGLMGTSTGTGSGVYGSSTSGAGVEGLSGTGPGMTGSSSGSSSPGVMGTATGNNAAGVYGTGTYVGVYGFAGTPDVPGMGTGVLGQGGMYGGFLSGGISPLCLDVNPSGVTNPNHDTNSHFSGEFYVDMNNGLWYCVSSGTPGTWNRLATLAALESANAGSLALLSAPTRYIDTRTLAESPSSTGTAAPAPASVVTTYIFTGTGALVPYTPSSSMAPVIPFGATGLVGRITVLNGQNGHTTKSGQLKVSNVNPPGFGSGLFIWAATAATQIMPFVLSLDNSSGTSGKMYFVNSSTADKIDLVVDVTGYYY